MTITVAGRAHDCRYNKRHRIQKGEHRLTIKDDRDEHHYCLTCAHDFMQKSFAKLQELHAAIRERLSETSAEVSEAAD
jgi:hypothetical protein